MTKPENNNGADRVWRTLVAAARRAPTDAMSAVDADRVLQTVALHGFIERAGPAVSDERLVSWAAAFALAASLLLTVTCWSDVAAAWSPEPTIFELPVDMEPLR